MSAVPVKPRLWPLLLSLSGVVVTAIEVCFWGFIVWACWTVTWPLMQFFWAVLV